MTTVESGLGGGDRVESMVGMRDARRGRMLLALLAANVVTSVLHYVDNVVNFRHYPEPTWLNPHLVDKFWFVMTACQVAGYVLYLRGRRRAAMIWLWLSVAMNLLVLGHYLIAPPWEVSFKINLFILAEALAALLLGGYLVWLQCWGVGRRPAHGEG